MKVTVIIRYLKCTQIVQGVKKKEKSIMAKLEQMGFDDTPVKYSTEKHVACVFLLDTSGSMNSNDAIGQLNEGLRAFKEQTLKSMDSRAKACIDVAVVTFDNDVQVIQDFTSVEDMQLPLLEANGMTVMGKALEKVMDMITEQKNLYNYAGTPYFRPWIFCITDGGPNDNYLEAAERLRWMEQNKKVVAYCVGVEGFNVDIMQEIFSPDNIFGLEGCDFTGLFKFVSSSLAAVRTSSDESGASIDVAAPATLFKIPLN